MSAAEAYLGISGDYQTSRRPRSGAYLDDYRATRQHSAVAQPDPQFELLYSSTGPELAAFETVKIADLLERIEGRLSEKIQIEVHRYEGDEINIERRGAQWERLFRNLAIGSAVLSLMGFAAMLVAWASGDVVYVIPFSVVAFGFILIAGMLLELNVRTKRHDES